MELISYEFNDNHYLNNDSFEDTKKYTTIVAKKGNYSQYSNVTAASEHEFTLKKTVSLKTDIDIVHVMSYKSYNKKNSFVDDYKPSIEEQRCFCRLI